MVKAEAEQQRRDWLQHGLGQLPERQREALHLRYHLELDYPDVAEILGVSQQVAYNYVNRGIKTLKKGAEDTPDWFFEK